MAEQKITVKLDPGQVAALRQFVRDEIRGERAAVSTPLEGWYEATTVADLAGSRRVFIRGANGDPDVRTAQIDLEKLRNRIRDLLQETADLPGGLVPREQVTLRLQELLK